jgi:hypothetical protein
MRKSSIIYILAFLSISFAQEYRKGDHELLIMPTAYTMPAKMSYFTDYELFFLNYTYAATSSTHISGLVMFPITSEFIDTFSIGAKQRLYQNEVTSVAAWGSFTLKSKTFMGGMVISAGSRKANFHLSVGTISPESESWETLYMLGVKVHTSETFAFILEYANMQEGFENEFGGLFTIGGRFIGESIAWDFGGIRPMGDSGDIFLFPLLKATVFFE